MIAIIAIIHERKRRETARMIVVMSKGAKSSVYIKNLFYMWSKK